MKKQKFKVKKGSETVLSVFSKLKNLEKISMTGYTMEAETDKEIFFYSDEQMNPFVFGFYSKLKKEFEKHPTPIAKQENVAYFNFKKGISAGTEYSNIYCVDINSAYLSALKKEGFLSPELFELINKTATKDQRLKCVGMLAKSKCHFHFSGGNISDVYFERSPLEGFFYHACEVTGKAMTRCERAIEDDFLYFWVDGIFCRTPEAANICTQILKAEGFESKIEFIEKMKFQKNYVYFEKSGKKKLQSIPVKTNPKNFANIADQLNKIINSEK